MVLFRVLFFLGACLASCNVESAPGMGGLEAAPLDLYELNATDTVQVDYQDAGAGSPRLQPIYGKGVDTTKVYTEPVVAERMAGTMYYVARFRLRTRLAEACDPTRGIVMRDGQDGQSLRFGVGEEGLLVHKPFGDDNWQQLPGVVTFVDWSAYHRLLRLTLSTTDLISITFHDLTFESLSILDRLSCYATATNTHSNLEYPPLYSRDAMGLALCNVVSRAGNGVGYDTSVPVACHPSNVRKEEWSYSNNTQGVAWMHLGVTSQGVFEFVSTSNTVKQYWMASLWSKRSLLEAHPDIQMLPGGLDDLTYWADGDIALPPTPQPTPPSLNPTGGDSDNDGVIPWYAVMVISCLAVCWVCLCIVVGYKIVERRRRRRPSRDDSASVTVQMDEVVPPPVVEVSPPTREKIDQNPIDMLMRKEKRSVKGTPSAHSAGRGAISDVSLDRFGVESSLGASESHHRGPVLAAARRYHASTALPAARTPSIDLVPGPGWESTQDATDLSQTASFSPTPRHSYPASYYAAQQHHRPSEGAMSTEITEGEYHQ